MCCNIDLAELYNAASIHISLTVFYLANSQAASPRVALEVGCGPLLSGLASASAWADLLIFSDLLPANLSFLLSSLHGTASCPALAFVAALEGVEVAKTPAPVPPPAVQESSLLSRLSSTPLVTTPCDLLAPAILPHLGSATPPQVIVVKLCLEFAADGPLQVVTQPPVTIC